jgi:hypothetical protein
MQAKMRQAYLFVVVAVVLGGAAYAQSGNPFIGTWKMNAAKSKFIQGPVIKSTTTKIEASGAGLKYTVDAVSDAGTQHWEFTTNLDGKDSPITGNSPYGDAVAQTRVDTHTLRSVYKKTGKVTATQTLVLSSDGKTRTVTTKGTAADGQPVDNVLTFDRQ